MLGAVAHEQRHTDPGLDPEFRPRPLDRVNAVLHPLRSQSLLLTLALPTFGLAFAISMLTTYGPVLLIELTDSRSEVVFEALPVDDPQVRQPDIARARDLLGWEPEIEVRDGIVRTIEQYMNILGQRASL